jgi:ERCC4-type nuclease
MSFVIVHDDREKQPWTFAHYPNEVTVQRLETGDYTVAGFEDVFAIERKSIADIIQTTTWGRDRFVDELERSQDFLHFVVIIEGYPENVEEHINQYGRKVHPNAVLGSVRSWEQNHNTEFIWCGSVSNAEYQAYHKLQAWYGTAHLNF